MPKYKRYILPCEICGKEFRRSADVDKPPRFCRQACLTKWRIGKAYVKYKIEPHWLPIIQKTYAEGTGNGEIKALAKRMRVPRTKITNLARAHGWIPRRRCSDHYWSPEELAVVESMPEHSPSAVYDEMVRRGYNRPISGIEVQRAKLRVMSMRENMTANDMALCLGVESHAVLRAIKTGKIAAKKAPGYEKKYMIKPKAARRYIIDCLPEIDFRKIDKYWLVDLLTDGKMGVRE